MDVVVEKPSLCGCPNCRRVCLSTWSYCPGCGGLLVAAGAEDDELVELEAQLELGGL